MRARAIGGACLPVYILAAASALLLAAIAYSSARADEAQIETPPSQIHRLTESQYRSAVADIFGSDIKVLGRFPPDLRIDGLQAVGSGAVSVNAASLEQYDELARGISVQVTDKAHRDRQVGCAPGAADPVGAQCARSFFQRVGLRLYRRPLNEAEVEAYTAATLLAAQQVGDFEEGLAASLAAMMKSPYFLFRIDRPDRTGRSVDGYSKAARLSFLLWNTTPDDALLTAAGAGELDSPEGRTRVVETMLSSPRFGDGQRAFFSDYLRLDGIDDLSKDTLIYPAFTATVASASREQTLRTITHLLVDRKGDFRDLFTTRSIAMHRSLGPIYDIPVGRNDWYIHEFPDGDPRSGLLTQASMLAQHSHPGRTSPTLRGLALNEIFLCEKVPSPPANVNFAVVQDVNNPTLKTTRERLQAHLDDEECASCHKRTDPMGLGLEQFDGAGQFRKLEHDSVIDVSGDFEARAFNGAAALGQLFHDSKRVSACFVQTAWRYAHGRNPSAGDKPAIDAFTVRFAEQEYRLAALMRMIALDPDFYAMPRSASPKKRSNVAGGSGGKGQS